MINKSISIAVVLICFTSVGGVLLAQTAGSPSAQVPSSQAGHDSFTLLVLGTRRFADIDLLRKTLKQLASVKHLQPSVSSQNHLQFVGLYTGDPQSLIGDIERVAADRFEVRAKEDSSRGLVITLKKTTN